ncbi:MAG: rhodanese-like domain-containing protein [Anaerolineae bacterium]|nr:rhodanese-like domain-containing protein [Anaerolineae bacterium]
MVQNLNIQQFRATFADNESAEYQLVDVREVDEFEAGRIPGAVNIPLSEFQSRFTEIENAGKIVLVCAAGGRSAMAADFMAGNGYESDDLYNLVDGTMGWLMRGLPLEK